MSVELITKVMDKAFLKEKDFVFPDRQNPWLAHYRPRASMNPFVHTPYAEPTRFGDKPREQPKWLAEVHRQRHIQIQKHLRTHMRQHVQE
jgi:hypothetical protein